MVVNLFDLLVFDMLLCLNPLLQWKSRLLAYSYYGRRLG